MPTCHVCGIDTAFLLLIGIEYTFEGIGFADNPNYISVLKPVSGTYHGKVLLARVESHHHAVIFVTYFALTESLAYEHAF